MNLTPTEQGRELIGAVVEILRQGERLMEGIRDEHLARKLPVAFGASVGGHYRHCLDHFRIVLNAANSGNLDYDRRERGTAVESDRFAALEATRNLIEGYENLDAQILQRPLAVTCKTGYSTRGSQVSNSTVGREIMCSVAHAVHHYALIGVMGGIMEMDLPVDFGIAPSTLKHQRETASAS